VSTQLKFSTSLNKRSFLLDRERPVFFSLAREKKMGGSILDQPLQMADLRPRRKARPPLQMAKEVIYGEQSNWPD
jgi:hypothetical protein